MINAEILDNPEYNSFNVEKILDRLEYIRCNSKERQSLESLAHQLGISASSYKRYLANENEPFKKSINTIYRICQYTDTMLFQLSEDDYSDNIKYRLINKITQLSDSQLELLEYYIQALENKPENISSKLFSAQRMMESSTILNSLYHKILFVNLTTDYFEPIQVEEKELELLEKTLHSNKLSKWIEWFSQSEFLHPDDVDYFINSASIKEMKTTMRFNDRYYKIKYRRLTNNGYTPVVIDVIKYPDYTSTNQTVLLCVRDDI